MSSQSVAKKLYGEQINTCVFCDKEYFVKESDAWEMTLYCSGECEVLDESDELVEDENPVYECAYCHEKFDTIDDIQDHADYDCKQKPDEE